MKTSSEPASRIPYDVPLRHIIVTMLDPRPARPTSPSTSRRHGQVQEEQVVRDR
jgi:hypothetical protein